MARRSRISTAGSSEVDLDSSAFKDVPDLDASFEQTPFRTEDCLKLQVMAEYLPNPLIDSDVEANTTEKRICIIGGGANGLATLKILAETPQVQSGQWKLIAFEERDNIGGIWLPAAPEGNPPSTPLYDSLTTNLPHLIMGYPSFPFPPETSLFPSSATVEKYLQDYATHFDLLHYIRLNTRVEETRWNISEQVWKVKLSSGELLDFDFVIAANGHYRLPRYPDTPGVNKWLDSGRAMHSAWYRRPQDIAHHQKVVVVGGGPSAIDISTDMRNVGTVLHSVPGEAYLEYYAYPPDADDYKKKVKIAEYKDNGDVLFEDGTTESNVDFAILATGYQFSFPFLPHQIHALPDPPPPLPTHLHNSSYHLFPLARHLFPLQADFPAHTMAHAQLPRVLADPSALDVPAEAVSVIERFQQLASEEGTDDPLRIAKAWLRFAPDEPFKYRAELNAFAKPGTEWRAPEWEIEFWDKRDTLRKEWKQAVKDGEGEELVKGVGKGGVEEWVDLCKKMLRRHEEREAQQAKL
ncbi:hypothetical protein EW146_g8056 [Bondarzewia mesenterica]|uniref:FAD/NAD(P)-binding domain-containing protein n=1 Tax=Bondarzewia mesenterica TaxID=1095465 RepID=A0A4V3XDX6_9AGAM|nr:hypothetical protein EW146_g8056 [Bondarzewia mesenterica]